MSTIPNDPNFFKNLQEEILIKFHAEVEKIAERVGLILDREVQDVLMKNDKYATGDAYKSVTHTVTKLTKAYIIKCFLGVKYAVFIHEDTRPHFPPVNKIAKWVRVKHLAGRYSIKSHRRLGKKMTQFEEDRALAYAIARKIARKGTKGIKFFEIALKQAGPYIEKELEKLKNA